MHLKKTKILLFIGGACAGSVQYNKFNQKANFEKNMKLIYPKFDQENKVGKVVSKSQLEYVIKQCNENARRLCVKGGCEEEEDKADILLDMSELNSLIEAEDLTVTVESGITISTLKTRLEEHGLQLDCFPMTTRSYDQVTLNDVIAENSLCVQPSMGRFTENNIKRLSFITGDGRRIQSGGYGSGENQMGPDLSSILYGTHNSLGISYEAVLKLKPMKPAEKYVVHTEQFKGYDEIQLRVERALADSTEQDVMIRKVPGIDANEYIMIRKKGDKEQISPYKKPDDMKLEKLEVVDQAEIIDRFLDYKFELSEHNSWIVDPEACNGLKEIRFVFPSKLGQMFTSLLQFLDTISMHDVGFVIYMLKSGSVQVDLQFRPSEEVFGDLDILTSQIIAYGGTVSARSKDQLDEISPYLQERMAGRAGYDVQQKVKLAFDPNDVLGSIFKIEHLNPLQKFRKENKQFNYALNQIGFGL